MGIPAYFSHVIREYKQIIKTLTSHANYEHMFLDSNSIVYDSLRKMEISVSDPDFEKKLIHAVCLQIEICKKSIHQNRFIAFDGVAPVANCTNKKLVATNPILKNNSGFMIPIQAHWFVEYRQYHPRYLFYGTGTKSIHFSNLQKNKEKIKISIKKSSFQYFGTRRRQHKIYERIRQLSPSLLKTNANIVVYGLDSDLIMLSLLHLKSCPNLYLFRETPHFIKTLDKTLDPEELVSSIFPNSKICCEKS